MASISHTHRPEATYRLPLLVSPLRHKSPSLPAMRHSPSLQTLNFHPLGLQPLNAFRASLPVCSFPETMIEDNDPTPRPLRIKKLRNSPSLPLGVVGIQDSRPTSHFARRQPPQPPQPPQPRTFLGLSSPPQPKPRSSSTGVLSANSGQSSNASSNLASGVKTIRRSSTQHNVTGGELPGAGMAWLKRPQSSRPAEGAPITTAQSSAIGGNFLDGMSTPRSGYVTAPTHCSTVLPGSRNSSGDATAGSSFRSSSYPSTEAKLSISPEQQDLEVLERGKKGASKLRRASSTSGAHGNTRNKIEEKNENKAVKDQVHNEPTEKLVSKGWKEKMFSRDFFTRASGGNNPKKELKAKGRERSGSFSSSTTVKTIAIPRPLTAGGKSTPMKRVDIPSNHSWCERSDDTKWKLDESDGRNNTGSFLGNANKGTFNDSVLGIFEGSVGDRTRTKLKKASHWKPPTLHLQMEVVSETEKVPISDQRSQVNDKVVWVSVELDGKVDGGTEGFEGSKVGLDVGILIDTSAYTSSTSFASMKLYAKKIVEAMETSRDRVAVMTFPSGSSKTGIASVRPDTIHVLNSSGSVAKRQLMDDIAALSQNKWSTDPISRNVRAAIQASVRKLKGMPLDTNRYGTHRHGHLFLLTTKLDEAEVELLPEVFFGEIQIHIMGIGPLFWPRNGMGSSGWCIPTGTLGTRPSPTNKGLTSDVGRLGITKNEEVTIEEIIRLLRTAVDLGVLYEVLIELDAGEHCTIRAVMGDLRYQKFVPGEKRTLLVQVHVGEIPTPDITGHFDRNGNHEAMPRWVILERQLEATLGELQGRLLTVRATYRHTNFPKTTQFTTTRSVEISRFAEDSLWRFSPTGNKLINKEESPSISSITPENYVKKVLIQRVASMHSSPTRALKAVQEIPNATSIRGIDLSDIFRELLYMERVEQRFKETRASLGDIPQVGAANYADIIGKSSYKPGICCQGTQTLVPGPPVTSENEAGASLKIMTNTLVDRDCRYRGSRELHNEDRAPFIAAMDPSPDIEIPDIDPEDEAQRIWLEIKLRQRGVSSGSIKRRSTRSKRSSSIYRRPQLDDRFSSKDECGDVLSTVYSSVSVSEEDDGDTSGAEVLSEGVGKASDSGQGTLNSLITLRDIRETDFGPWAM